MNRRRTLNKLVRIGLGLVVATGLVASVVGCGDSFDPKSKMQTLRVLAVRADNPYPKPGDTVHLDMLWFDGKAPPTGDLLDGGLPEGGPPVPEGGTPDGGLPEGGPPVGGPGYFSSRQVQIVWIGGCFNPLGNQYYGCYSQLAESLGAAQEDPASFAKLVGLGSSFNLEIPADIISGHPAAEGQTPNGLAFVFFAVCAGEVRPAEPGPDGLPLGCFDPETDARLGADDFVPGYASLYSFDGIRNTNPVLTAFKVNGVEIAETEHPSFPRCTSANCSEIDIQAVVDPASVEPNPLSPDKNGNPQGEMMWVDYYTTDGKLKSESRLVNDATTGFNADHGTKLTMPAEAQDLHLFGIAHDSRGGVQWMHRVIRVE